MRENPAWPMRENPPCGVLSHRTNACPRRRGAVSVWADCLLRGAPSRTLKPLRDDPNPALFELYALEAFLCGPPALTAAAELQGMVGLAMLMHDPMAPSGGSNVPVLVDANATLFSSQYGYRAEWWARQACFADYFGADGEPPVQRATGTAPYAMHFNGPAGRYRLGCVLLNLYALYELRSENNVEKLGMIGLRMVVRAIVESGVAEVSHNS
eukprot:2465845-Pleurochrysis_carterae.AAC.1